MKNILSCLTLKTLTLKPWPNY